MKVKITGCSSSSYWYDCKIGKCYDVIEELDDMFRVSKEGISYASISKKDCKVIEEDFILAKDIAVEYDRLKNLDYELGRVITSIGLLHYENVVAILEDAREENLCELEKLENKRYKEI